MGKEFTELLPTHMDFIKNQKIFFVGTAPLSETGHVNLSPKGYDVFRVFSPNELAYLDLTGSGNETSAHVKENGRITIMFMALEGPPMILRLYGKGKVILPDSEEWDSICQHFEHYPGTRQIIKVDVSLVKTSCGYSVPFFSYSGERETLNKWAINKGEQGIEKYWEEKNSVSMDGLVTHLGERNYSS